MNSRRSLHPVVAVVLAFALVLSPLTPVLQAQEGTNVWLPLIGTGITRPSVAVSDVLFRAEITVTSPSRWSRLDDLGVTILERHETGATVLVDYEQLADLARLRFDPRNSEEFGALVNVGAEEKPWLTRSLQPLGEQAQTVRTEIGSPLEAMSAQSRSTSAALMTLRAAAQSLTMEQRSALSSLPSLDDDGDGLTNTEEGWWCTDPLNLDSNGNGYTDGDTVTALLDFSLLRQQRSAYGPPFRLWPPFVATIAPGATPTCLLDADKDSIPDLAEQYVIGSSHRDESTDGDKFDDGQEFFGITYCPGGATFCNYGQYPREIDSSFISERLPTWVRPPGDNPFVAAYPVIEFNVDPSTIRITTKEIKTLERTITQGEEISTGFAETKGNSTTVGTIDTNTTSGWKEHSSTQGGIEPAQISNERDLRVYNQSHDHANFVSSSEAPISSSLVDYSFSWICKISEDRVEIADSTEKEERSACYALGLHYLEYAAPTESDYTSIVIFDQEYAHDVKDTLWVLLRYGHFDTDQDRFLSQEPRVLIGRKTTEMWSFPSRDDLGKWITESPFFTDTPVDQRRSSSLDRLQGYRLPFQQKLGTVLVTQTEQAEGGCYPTIVEPEQPLAGCSHYRVNAYDFNLRDGHVILAAKSGVVGAIRTDSNRGCGSTSCAADANYIRIDHLSDDGSWVSDWYLHLAPQRDPLWQVGQKVNQGDPLGIAGSTGYSTGPHLHFDVRYYSSWPDSFSGYLKNYSSSNSLKVSFDEVRQDKSSCGNDQGKLLYIDSQGQRCSYKSTQQLWGPACYAPPVSTLGPTPGPAPSTAPKQKSTNFIVRIGQAFSSLWGRLTGGNLRSGDSLLSATNCSPNMSCANIGGRSSTPIDYSSTVSAGACGGSGGQPNGGTLGVGGGGAGLAYNDDGGGNFTALRTWSETTTTGEGWSTSHSQLRSETEYSEITRSTVNTLVSSESWATATTVDPTDAARLTFDYFLANTGSDLAVDVTDLRANILIGDLPVITVDLSGSTDIQPSRAKGPLSSGSISLTLDQLAAIDNGAPIRVVLADYDYNDDLYDTNAWGRSVLFYIDDGIEDGDETFDAYMIATNLKPNETYQETLSRYFPVTVFEGGPNDPRTGTLTSITTPEYDDNGEIVEWVKRPVNDRAWWELSLSTGGETPGVKNFKEMPAKPKTYVYLRYMVDTDGDGYTDRTEVAAGTDLNDAESHPRPLLVAARHTTVSDNQATVQLALQNLGDFDASSVEIWAIAPDDSITIHDNLVGGGGRVRAGRRVVLGARIGAPDLTTWVTSTAKPAPNGQYDGAVAKTFQFRADAAGTVGSTAGLQISWSSDGATWTPLNVGSGYTAWTPLGLSDGLSIAFTPGTVAAGETFRFETALPLETFSYTINRTPHTSPLLVVSYNDAQGNYKFVTEVESAQIQEDLTRYYADMRRGLQLDVRQAAPFQSGANQAWLTLHNPSDTAIHDGNLFVNVVTPDGTVAKEYVLIDQTFEPGPNVVTLDWNTADFSPAYDPNAEYHLLVIAADRQGTIIEHTLRSLDTLTKDALPTAIFTDATWDFGSVIQGEVLERTFALANVGFADLHSRLQLPQGISLLNTTSRRSLPGDMADFTLTLDTRTLPTGPYTGAVTLRTSDPANPLYTVQVSGTIEPLTGDAYARPVVDRPLDVEVWVAGDHNQGEWVEFTHKLGPESQSLHPVKVYSQDYVILYGVGKYATDFQAGILPANIFGTGADNDITVSSDTTFNTPTTSLAASASAGQTVISVGNASGFGLGDEVLLIQMQGAGAGNYEFHYIAGVSGNQLTLISALKLSYTQGGAAKAQVIRVPNYRSVTVTSTGRWRAPAWNGSIGGILVFRASEQVNIAVGGLIDASARGFRGGAKSNSAGTTGQQGESDLGIGATVNSSGCGGPGTNRNGNGGGGGNGDPGDDWHAGGGGGGGHATSGSVGGCSRGHAGGQGGYSVGTAELTKLFLGGGGGAGGTDNNDNLAGNGGNGAGAIMIFGQLLALQGSITSNGAAGGEGNSASGGAGGGAGGAIKLTGAQVTIGNDLISAAGGAGGNGNGRSGGGAGAPGYVRVEYCVTFSGSANLAVIAQRASCYISEQIKSDPYDSARLNLSESFNGGRTFKVQYGRYLQFVTAGIQATTIRLPKRLYSKATLDAMVSGLGNGDVTIKLDIGGDGWDWEETQTITNAGTFSSPDLAKAFANYVTGTGDRDVEVKVYLSKTGQVLLTNMVIERNESVDVTPSFALSGTPTEGTTVPLNVTLTNNGAVDSGPLTVSYYATRNTQQTYIGSSFVPSVAAGTPQQVTFDWDTLGFTGPVTVTAVVDPYNRLAESDETNNSQAANLTILTRPDLEIATVTLSDEEPLAGETVTVTVNLKNDGQTAAGAQKLALYRDNPDGGGSQIRVQNVSTLNGGANRNVALTWTPSAPGLYRLFLRGDRDNVVNEYDESNNDRWLDVYVGMASPLSVDSGGAGDTAYSAAQGFGVIDSGDPDEMESCGTAAYQTFRRDPSGRVIYRFDHLQPGHFYHLDLVLFECEQNAGRQQRVSVDGIEIAGPIDLGGGAVQNLSLLLDPALYADRSIEVAVTVDGTGGALVNQIALVDVDYRYADAGGAKDVQYPSGARPYGWLDGVRQTAWGTLPFQSLRENQSGNEMRYRFDALDPNKEYQVHFSFYQGGGNNRVQQIWVDDVIPLSGDFTLIAGQRNSQRVDLPKESYSDGTVTVAVRRSDGATTGAMINEIALEEVTQARTATCQVTSTPSWTVAFGNVTVAGQPAAAGTVVTAENPRGDVVGCYVVNNTGQYGFMSVFGEDASGDPVIPGMKAGEPVIFRVNGVIAVPAPLMTWQDNKTRTRIDLAAGITESQYMLLRPNWNLLSTRMTPPVPLLSIVFQSIAGKYCQVLGPRGIYDCTVPASFQSLKEIEPGKAYYTKINGGASVNMVIEGVPLPADSPIPLESGLNWVGYLPETKLPIATALDSISAQLVQVADGQGQIYDPAEPGFSNLLEMTPGHGYLIHLSDAATLVYPSTGAAQVDEPAAAEEMEGTGSVHCGGVEPTPYFTAIYGRLSIHGVEAVVGDRVEVLTPRGEVAGCFTVSTPGQYGFLSVFGADNATGGLPGFVNDEPMTLQVNGRAVGLDEPLLWRDDKSTHRLDLDIVTADPIEIYLPFTTR